MDNLREHQMRRKTRLVILFAALAGVGAWAAFGGKEGARRSEDVAAAAPKPSAPEGAPGVVLAAAPAAAPQDAAEMPARPSLDQMGADPFNVEAPRQAPAEAAPAAPPPPPAAPPMPYRFAGRLHVGDSTEFYLAKGDKVIAVKKGDKLDGEYRVDKIGRTEMTLVHLASGAREKLEYAPPIDEDESAAAEALEATHATAKSKTRSTTSRTAALRRSERGG
jgi:hypothetical protein